MSVYEKFLEIQRGVDRIIKDGENKNDKYDYVSGSNVLSIIRPMLNELGLLCIPRVESTNILEGQTRSGTARFTVEMWGNMEWIDVESEDHLAIPFYANGSDLGSAERAVGKALTYAEKYHLLKLFHIPTDKDDPDNDKRTKAGEKAVRGTAAENELVELYKASIPAMLNELYGNDEEKTKAAYIARTKNDKRGYAGVDSLERITDSALAIVYGKLVKQYEKRTGHAFELPKEDDPE